MSGQTTPTYHGAETSLQTAGNVLSCKHLRQSHPHNARHLAVVKVLWSKNGDVNAVRFHLKHLGSHTTYTTYTRLANIEFYILPSEPQQSFVLGNALLYRKH